MNKNAYCVQCGTRLLGRFCASCGTAANFDAQSEPSSDIPFATKPARNLRKKIAIRAASRNVESRDVSIAAKTTATCFIAMAISGILGYLFHPLWVLSTFFMFTAMVANSWADAEKKRR